MRALGARIDGLVQAAHRVRAGTDDATVRGAALRLIAQLEHARGALRIDEGRPLSEAPLDTLAGNTKATMHHTTPGVKKAVPREIE